MRPGTKGAIGGAAGVLVVFLIGLLIFLYVGIYNVAATVPHTGVER